MISRQVEMEFSIMVCVRVFGKSDKREKVMIPKNTKQLTVRFKK